MIHLRNLFLFTLLLINSTSRAQYWLQSGGGLTIDEALAIASDPSGNAYTAGYFTTSANIDGISVTSAGLNDVFICKTDVSGNIGWVKTGGGPNSDKALGIAVDNGGNI